MPLVSDTLHRRGMIGDALVFAGQDIGPTSTWRQFENRAEGEQHWMRGTNAAHPQAMIAQRQNQGGKDSTRSIPANAYAA